MKKTSITIRVDQTLADELERLRESIYAQHGLMISMAAAVTKVVEDGVRVYFSDLEKSGVELK